MQEPLPRVEPVQLPVAPSTLTADQRYWAAFKTEVKLPSATSSPVTFISSNISVRPTAETTSQNSPYIAVTTGPRLQLLTPQTLKVAKSITRTTSPFHAAHVRRDGRICVAGSDSGVIQAFDTSSRAILKTWKEHKQPVWLTKWHPSDLTSLMSCSDDRTVRVWDLPSDQSVWTGVGHNDYVRAGTFIGDQGNMATGSYDKTIRIWDPRVNSTPRRSAVMQFRLPDPVEAVSALPGGTTLVGGTGQRLVVLDLVAAKPLGLFENHQKTITSLSMASQGTRVLTGSLDGHVKVWDTETWSVIAGRKYPSPVLSLEVIPSGPDREDKHLCVGMQSGVLSIRTRLTQAAIKARKEKEKEMAALVAGKIDEYDSKKRKRDPGSSKFFPSLKGAAQISQRGRDFTGEGADIVIDGKDRSRPAKKSAWEHALYMREYAEALNIVMEIKRPSLIYTVLLAAHHRNALAAALRNRTAGEVAHIVEWIAKRIDTPDFQQLKLDVAMLLIDLYGPKVPQSVEVEQAFGFLTRRVMMRCQWMQNCVSSLGMMEMLASAERGTRFLGQ